MRRSARFLSVAAWSATALSATALSAAALPGTVPASCAPAEWSVEGACPAAPGDDERQEDADVTSTAPASGDRSGRSAGQPYGEEEPGDEGPGEGPGEGPDGDFEHGRDHGEDPGGGHPDEGGGRGEEGRGEEGRGEQGRGEDSHSDREEDAHGRKDPHDGDDRRSTNRPPVTDHGVDAGGGGAFTDSVPAMAAGCLLVAGALGAAVQRVRPRRKGSSARR